MLVTHGHRDHFDPSALRRLAATVPEVVARPELHDRLAALGFRTVTDLGWWDHTRVGEVDVTAVPARHRVPENGYVLGGGGVTVYVAGDTRYFDELVDVATVFPGLDAAASYLGLTGSQLDSKLESGKTLAQVAKDQGKSVDGLVAAMKADLKQKLDRAVSDGRITKAEEDQALEDAESRITNLVNGKIIRPARPERWFGRPDRDHAFPEPPAA